MNHAGRGNDSISIPTGWACTPLSHIAALTRGLSWNKSEESADGVPVVTIPNIRDRIVDFDVAYRLSKEVPQDKLLSVGDVLLVGSSGSVENIGRAAVVPNLPTPRVTFASFLVRATPIGGKVTREYLGHILTDRSIDYRSVARRAADGKWNLQLEELKRYQVVYPQDEAEQIAICEALASVSRVRESHRLMADALKVLFDSLRTDLLAGRRRMKKHE